MPAGRKAKLFKVILVGEGTKTFNKNFEFSNNVRIFVHNIFINIVHYANN